MEEKPRTVFIGNIPKGSTKREIEAIFGDFKDSIKRCFIQYPKNDDKDGLMAYISFADSNSAETAITQFKNHKIGKNKLNMKLTRSRPRAVARNSVNLVPLGRPPSIQMVTRGIRGPIHNIQEVEQKDMVPSFRRNVDDRPPPKRNFNSDGDNQDNRRDNNLKPKMPKPPRVKGPTKKSRIIVRNLSFQATEEKIKKHFSKCGEITEVSLLRKHDGKLVGCGFVQYATVFEAIKALKELNMTKFMGRPIAIDWAVPKEQYNKADSKPVEVKEESVEIKEEENDEKEEGSEAESSEGQSEGSNDEEDDEEEEDDDDEEDDEEENSDEDVKPKKKIKLESDPKSKSKEEEKRNENDADEGKTLFVRNLSYEVTDEELKDFFKKFGSVCYAIICKNKLTEYSKGTGFVKFWKLEDAEKCLDTFERDSSSFRLSDRFFTVTLAITRDKVKNISSNHNYKNTNNNSNRNF